MSGIKPQQRRPGFLLHATAQRSIALLVQATSGVCLCGLLVSPHAALAQSKTQQTTRQPVSPKSQTRTKPGQASARSASHAITALSLKASLLPASFSLSPQERPQPPYAQAVSQNGWTLYSRNVNRINDFARIGDETWLATGMGIKRIQNRTKTVRHYTTADGLPDATIYAIGGDASEVWCLSYALGGDANSPHRKMPGYSVCRWNKKTDRWEALRDWEDRRPISTDASPFADHSGATLMHRVVVTPQYVGFLSGVAHLSATLMHLYDRQKKEWLAIPWPQDIDPAQIRRRRGWITFFHMDSRSIWIGYEGLRRYRLDENRWEHLLPDYVSVHGGYRDKEVFWLSAMRWDEARSARSNHLLRFHTNTGKVEEIKIAAEASGYAINALQEVFAPSLIVPDGKNSLWMVTGLYPRSTPALNHLALDTGRVTLNYGQVPQSQRMGDINPKALEPLADNVLIALLTAQFPLPVELVARRLPGWICAPHGVSREMQAQGDTSAETLEWKDPNGAIWRTLSSQQSSLPMDDGGWERIIAGKSERILLPDTTQTLRPPITALTIQNNEIRAQTMEGEYRSPLPEIRWSRHPLPAKQEVSQPDSSLPKAPEEALETQFPEYPQPEREAVLNGLIWYSGRNAEDRLTLAAWDPTEKRWRGSLAFSKEGRILSLLAAGEQVYLLIRRNFYSPPAGEDGLYLFDPHTDQWKQTAPFGIHDESNTRYILNGGGTYYEHFATGQWRLMTPYASKEKKSDTRFTLITHRAGSLWAATSETLTLWEWNVEANQWRSYPTPTLALRYPPQPEITRWRYPASFAGTLHGDYLYARSDRGLWRFHFPTRTWESLPLPFPARRLRLAVPVGDARTLWAMTERSEIVRYEPAPGRWTFWDETKGVPRSNKEEWRRLFFAGGDIRLAVSGAFYRLNPVSGNWEPQPGTLPQAEETWRQPQHASGDENALWYAFEDYPTDAARRRSAVVPSQKSLARYDLRKEQWEIITLPVPFQFWSIVLAEPEALWITGEGKLWRLDKKTRNWTALTPPAALGLPPNASWDRLIRVGKSLWLVSREQLLCCTSPIPQSQTKSKQ